MNFWFFLASLVSILLTMTDNTDAGTGTSRPTDIVSSSNPPAKRLRTIEEEGLIELAGSEGPRPSGTGTGTVQTETGVSSGDEIPVASTSFSASRPTVDLPVTATEASGGPTGTDTGTIPTIEVASTNTPLL